MKEGRSGNAKRRLNWFLLILVCICGYFAYVFFMQQMNLNALKDDTEAARARLANAQQENEELSKEREALDDLDYIEKIAREELGMTRQGEMPYIYQKKK